MQYAVQHLSAHITSHSVPVK